MSEVISELVELSADDESAVDAARAVLVKFDADPSAWNSSFDDIAVLRALVAEYDALNDDFGNGMTISYMQGAEAMTDATRQMLAAAVDVFLDYDAEGIKKLPPSVQAIWQIGRRVANRVIKKDVPT